MEVLLHVLYRNRICCHLSGNFVTYLAQVFNKHGSMCLYVAKHDASLLNILFQGGEYRIYRSGRVSVRPRSTRFRLGYGEVYPHIWRLHSSTYRWGEMSVRSTGPGHHFVCVRGFIKGPRFVEDWTMRQRTSSSTT